MYLSPILLIVWYFTFKVFFFAFLYEVAVFAPWLYVQTLPYPFPLWLSEI